MRLAEGGVLKSGKERLMFVDVMCVTMIITVGRCVMTGDQVCVLRAEAVSCRGGSAEAWAMRGVVGEGGEGRSRTVRP